jgi:hypothetical protein
MDTRGPDPRGRAADARGDGRGRGDARGSGATSVPERDEHAQESAGRARSRKSRTLELFRTRHLDLERPAEEPLEPEEVREMRGHLAFLKRWKSSLRLGLNAQEDRLVNGELPPSDRGLCKHLLAKLDRTAIDRALAREPLVDAAPERARFLGGVVRIAPDADNLLRYLDALAAGGERREAAAALPETVARLDFARMGARGVAHVLELVRKLFDGPDRVQALFGLLTNDSFRSSLEGTLPSLDAELRADFAPLMAAHRALFEPERPEEDDDARALERGLEHILSAPEAVLRSYPESIRARLAEVAMELRIDASDALRRLMHGLPLKEPAYVELRRLRVDQLLREGAVDDARALVRQVATGATDAAWAKPLEGALAGKVVGRVVVGAALSEGSRLQRALWLDRPGMVLARTAPVALAGTLAVEAKLQAELTLPTVAPVLAHGLGHDGTAFLVIPPLGGPYAGVPERWPAVARLHAALEVVRLLSSLAERGLVLPDLAPTRMLSSGGRLVLADLSGIVRDDPGRAAIALAPLGSAWVRELVREPSRELARRARGQTSLVLLARALADAMVD